MKKITLGLLIAILFTSCWPCNSVIIDNGNLPDSVFSLIPYQNQKKYQFEHSAGKVITFRAQRALTYEESSCAECCDVLKYQVDKTDLYPDYPISNITISLSNLDTNYIDFSLGIGRSGFAIPSNTEGLTNTELVDSVLVGDTYYYDVFKLKSFSWSEQEGIYTDSLYYNFEYGILKLIMSNEEYYQIYQ